MKIKNYLSKHKKLFVIVSISLIVISLLGGSYAMFQRLDKAEYANNYKTGLLQIVFDDTSEGLGGVINVEGAVPTANSDGANLTPYKFKIINQGNLDYKFDLKLVIDADYTTTHGCNDKQLSADYIMIKFNDEEPVVLSSLTDNVIKSNIELKAGEDVTYELRAWLKEGAPNEEIGKHYHGKLTTNGNAVYTKDTIPNAPVLAEGMIPITYDGTNWVKANTKNTNFNWYDYSNKMWANAVMVTSDKRDTYMNAEVGTEVKEDDVLAYYVWIPRYKYKLFNVDFASNMDFESEAITADAQLIDVVFESGTESTGTTTCQVSEIGVETCTNKENGNYYTHPAFTFGDTELKGIWVGKFETTGSESAPTVKPNAASLTSQNVSTQFTTSQVFNSTTYLSTNGVNQSDTHMMKNIEWGAVAYLKQSKYGLGTTEIGINNYFISDTVVFKTGCGAIAGSEASSTCNGYNTPTGMLASTTGNVTGVYDMSGGADEYVMGVMQDNTSSRSPMSGNSTNNNSGYIGKTGESYIDSGNTLAFPDSKYYDLYANGSTDDDQTAYNRSHLGDATAETNWWYNDFASFVYSYAPWFLRGGNFSYGDIAGVFCFNDISGEADVNIGFRVVLSTTGA